MNDSSFLSLSRRFLLSLTFILSYTSLLFAVPSYTGGVTAAQLAAKIQGPGITISNPVLTIGGSDQVATFTNGNASGLAIDEGILLSGMDVDNAFTTNSVGNQSDDVGLSNWISNSLTADAVTDPNLIAIDSRARYDTIVFEFDVTLGDNVKLLLVNYQFASEEYNEYVGTIFNDAFGFFVSGGDLTQTYNIARVLNPNVFTTITNLNSFPPVTVNNVNNGIVGTSQTAANTATFLTNNTQYFTDNTGGAIEVEFDGLTVGLNGTLDNLTPGETYHFKMALADVGDFQWDTGVFVNSINGIRAPQVCYEYGYSQNDRFFTETYDENVGPKLVGDVVVGDPVTINVSIQNLENSEINASHVKLTVSDINDTQAPYKDDSVFVTNTNTLIRVNIPDNTQGMTNIVTDITDIPALNFGSLDFFYVAYDLDPQMASLDMPLNFKLEYNLTIPLSPTQSIDIKVIANLDEDVPNCDGGGYNYDAAWSIFNVEDRTLADTGKYNLYTQVAGRPFKFNLVSYDPAAISTSVNTTAFVAIEMIDAKGFQTVGAACRKPSSAFTPRIWTQLVNKKNGEIDIQQAVDDGFIDNISDFFPAAREKASFRISYLLDKNGTTPVTFRENPANGLFIATGFPTLTGRDCTIDPRTGDAKEVKNPNNSNLTDKANVACGNAGNTGVTAETVRNCLECLYDANVAYICSRDDFAIRPEAFKISIYDNQESVLTTDPATLLPNIAGSSTAIAAGYKYRYDVNATLHNNDNGSTPGYSKSFSAGKNSTDSHLTYFWRPDSITDTSGCNDINDKHPDIYLNNGSALNYQNYISNIGLYDLEMRDQEWTAVDQSPDHHIAPYFNLDADCAVDEDFTPLEADTLTNLNVGCVTSSEHINPETPYTYNDNNITARPFFFDLSQINFQKGIMLSNNDYNATEVLDINLTTGRIISILNRPIDSNLSSATDLNASNSFVYQNNILNANDDFNMSVRYSGHISARGADDNLTTNFVDNCYSQSIDLDVITSAINQANFPPYSFRLRQWSDTGVLVSDDINGSYDSDVDTDGNNNLISAIVLPASAFNPARNGAANIELNLNFDRQVNVAMNPIAVTYNDFNITCTNRANCRTNANMSSNHDANGLYTDANPSYVPVQVVHLYGREHIPRQRSATQAINVLIDYEFYCDSAGTSLPAPCNIGTYNALPLLNPISANAIMSRDDVRWYIHETHDTLVDGNPSIVTARVASQNTFFTPDTTINMDIDPVTQRSIDFRYNGNSGFPFKTTIQVITPDWLIYNRYDGGATVNNSGNVVNNFELEFSGTGNWSGKNNSRKQTDSDASANTNRRIQW